jgi:hypothetical protein
MRFWQQLCFGLWYLVICYLNITPWIFSSFVFQTGDFLTLPSFSVTVTLFSPCGPVELLLAGPPMWMHLCRCTFLLFFLWCWSSCLLQGLHFPLSHLGLHLPCISYVTLFLLFNLLLLQLGSLQHCRWRTYFFQNIAAILPDCIMVS